MHYLFFFSLLGDEVNTVKRIRLEFHYQINDQEQWRGKLAGKNKLGLRLFFLFVFVGQGISAGLKLPRNRVIKS